MRALLPPQVRSSRMTKGAVRSLLAAVLLQLCLPACGPVEEPAAPMEPAAQTEELSASNGLSLNGLSLNGLSLNGLSLNGLSLNGLSSSDFTAWFSRDSQLGNEVMTYLVRCALPQGESRSYTDPVTGQSYTWQGTLGLAPDWSGGQPATVTEQQLISACLAAHVNKYGRSVSISVLGETARKTPIFSSYELKQYREREACFFGNLFTGEGVFAGNDRGSLRESESTARGCGRLTSDSSPDECPPIIRTGSCQSICQLDSKKTYYRSCTFNGRRYIPLTTRILSTDIYQCGDGTCQFTESCGTGREYYNCASDCGSCG